MTDVQRGWIAGFLEGEGSFGAHPAGKNMLRNPQVQAGSTDEDAIRRLHEYAGAGRVYGPYMKRSQSGVGKPQWAYRLFGIEAIRLMEAILPLMCERRSAKIQSILDWWRDGRKAQGPTVNSV